MKYLSAGGRQKRKETGVLEAKLRVTQPSPPCGRLDELIDTMYPQDSYCCPWNTQTNFHLGAGRYAYSKGI